MSSDVSQLEDLVVEDKTLEALLDAVDERTRIQEILHNHIGDGFMSLARERYRETSSAERLGRLVYDDRDDVRSSVHVAVEVKGDQDVITMSREYDESEDSPGSSTADSKLRRRKGNTEPAVKKPVDRRTARHADVRNSFMAVPSAEIRETIRSFRSAVDQAIELVNTDTRLKAAIHTDSES